MIYSLQLPGSALCGPGCLLKLPELLLQYHAASALLITDKGVRGAGLCAQAEEEIAKAGIRLTVLDSIPSEPAYTDVQQLVDQARAVGAQVVVAIGGGSVMDTAKLCALLAPTKLTVKDLLQNPTAVGKGLPTVMVPTTCGTGSEATCNAIVAVPEEKLKVGIVNTAMVPDRVLLDPDLIAQLPKKILAATAVDALAHCVECYTSNKANPFSDTFAKEGARLIFHNLCAAFDNPGNTAAKEALMLGAYYGGIAITASGTTAVHALSYPLGGRYHIAHGVSNALLFTEVMCFNEPACRDPLAKLWDAVKPNDSCLDPEQKSAALIARIGEIVRHVEIPQSLSAFGIGPDALEDLTVNAAKVTRLLNNNRRPLSLDDIRGIYQKLL